MNREALDPPRWKGGPPVCQRSNLPTFDTEATLRDYFAALPAVTVEHVYLCMYCQGYEAVTKMRPPSGATSGSSTREQTGRKTKP